MAAEDSELSAIASANYALASFEAGDSSGAIRSARQLLRRRVHACVRVPGRSACYNVPGPMLRRRPLPFVHRENADWLFS